MKRILQLVVIVLCVGVMGESPSARTDMSANLMAFWSLADLTDDHDNNDLTNNGSTTFASAKVGNGADFNGSSQSLTITDNTDLSMGDINFSVQAWAKFDDLSTTRVVFSKSDSITGTVEYGCYGDSTPSIKCRVGTNLGYVIATCATGTSTGVWYHIVFYNSATVDEIACVVNDGTPGTASTAGSAGVSDGAESFRIGDDGSGRYMDGLIDQVAVWKRQLSGAEITELYNSGSGRTYSETIGSGGGGGSSGPSGLLTLGAGGPGAGGGGGGPTGQYLASLMGYWSADEASGNLLDSHFSNHLTETSGTIASTTGRVSNARDFELGDSEEFVLTDNADVSMCDCDFSIAFWVKLETDTTVQAFVSKYTGANLEYQVYYDGAGTNTFKAYISSGASFANLTLVNEGNIYTADGNWRFIVVRHDATANTWDIGIDGDTTPTSTSYSSGAWDSTSALHIGSNIDLQYVDGLMDEVAIWKRKLTTAEVTWLYNSGSGRSYADLAAQ